MSELGMYFGIAVGCIALLGVCGGILYRKYQQEKRVKVAFEQQTQQQTQERLQQVADMNLPPFYIDHELDPVCIYEHELPPDVLPPVQPIFVHPASDEAMLIPPEEDPLFPQSDSLPINTNDQQSASDVLFSPATTVISNAGTGANTPSGVSTEGYFDLLTPPPPAAAVSSSRPGTPSSTFTASSVPTPRPINQEMLNLARVRAPPSYDIPNLVVDRSPLYHPSTHLFSSPSPSLPFTPYSEGGHHRQHQPVRDDYFGHVRLRAHTFSHPSSLQSSSQSFLQQLQQHQQHQQLGHDWTSQQQQQQQQGGEDEELPETPRYSLEFPSDVPHEHHLEHHQRSRALYDNSVLGSPQSSHSLPPLPSQVHSPASFSPSSRTSWDYYDQDQGPSIQLQARTSSTSSLTGSHSSSPLLMFETTTTTATSTRTRRSPSGMRARASTLGESSKALMQRMHSLLRHSTSYSNSRESTPATSPRLTPAGGNTSSASGSSAQGGNSGSVPMVGLGLEYGGHVVPEPLQQDWDQDQDQDHTIVVVVDESEEVEDTTTGTTNNISSIPFTASSRPISLPTAPSAVSPPSINGQEAVSTTEAAVAEVEEEEEEEDESVSKTQRQHAPSEPMQTIPMPLAVS